VSPDPVSPDPLTTGSVLRDLATAAGLEVGDVDRDEPLDGLGVDSIRLMSLVDRWRTAGTDVSFPQIASARTVDDVLRLLDV